MFDKEIVKEELESVTVDVDVDLDEIIDNYEIIKGFYVFRVNDDAHFFLENNFIETAPGYYAIQRGDESNVGH